MKECIITREEFCKIINNIQSQKQKENKLSDAVEQFIDGWFVLNESFYEKELYFLLKKIFNDKNDYIGWWLFEDVEKIIYINNGRNSKSSKSNENKIVLNTPEKLYDFLIRNMNCYCEEKT